MGTETNSNKIIGYMALDENIALQCFAHPFLPVDFYGQAKLNRKAAAGFEQKKHEGTAE